MKYKELVDHVLGALYHAKDANPSFGLTGYWIVSMLDPKYTPIDSNDVMKYLDTEGFINNFRQKSGYIHTISTRGQVHFESLPEEYINKINNTLEEKGILDIIDKLSNIGEADQLGLDKVNETLDLIEEELNQLEKNIDKDLFTDLEMIRMELSKRNPDEQILKFKIETLLEANIIPEKIKELEGLLNL